MKAAICDDQIATVTIIEKLLLDYPRQDFDIDAYSDPLRFLQNLQDNRYDLYFLDIEMPGADGIQLAEKIREKDAFAPIIFLTSYEQYMPAVFRLQTFDYIMKPPTKEKLFPVLDRAAKFLTTNEKKFNFEFNRKAYSIPFNEIIYFEKDRRKVIIHALTDQYSVTLTTKELLDKLQNDFVQIHTSYIVNSRYIKEIDHQTVTVKTDDQRTELPLSRGFQQEARQKIIAQMRELL